MRIVIDLQCCQTGTSPAAIDLAEALAAGASGHEWWIALSDRFPASIEPLRARLSASVPRERIRVYELPLPPRTASQWSDSAAELVQANFFAALGADAVLSPAGATSPGVVQGPASAFDPYITVTWSGADPGAVQRQLDQALAARKPTAKTRPRLAYISPLPPSQSGIADYSAELAPQLARFYDLELVIDQDSVVDARLDAYPQRSVAWFDQHAHQFDRVLYHFGNSHAHAHMFDLIRRHPGVVLLHDFYLSGILDNLEREGAMPHGFLDALYESHGYTALLEQRSIGRNATIWKYPANRGVLDHATGVIVHSDFSKQLASCWYGKQAGANWRTVPLLRGKQNGANSPDARRDARAGLGLGDDDFMVCSFGMLGATKLNEELLDAFLASPLAADPNCKLVFVGQQHDGAYGAAMEAKILTSAAGHRIAVTGFVSTAQYTAYLLAADAAVQLRSSTRGETSAAILDCLLYGVPTIVNAHGSAALLDEALVFKLPDAVSVDELAGALARLHADPDARASLGRRASAFVAAEHAPPRAGQLVSDAIEYFATNARISHYQRLLARLAALPAAPAPHSAELAACARAVAANQGGALQRQLLVDVSALVTSDLRTGIQRVVRSVLLALIAAPPHGVRIEPVFSVGANQPYQYARRFSLGLIEQAGLVMEDAPVELHPGDTFLGLDLFTTGTSQNEALLQSMRDFGVNIYFVVYDILPMLRPEVFPYGTEQYFGDYLRTVARVADGLLCISRSVADELHGWIAAQRIVRLAPLQLGYFHLGADIGASAPTFGLPEHAEQVFTAVAARPSFLMVGTVEPRKGHAQALAALELLWQKGVDVNLVIVGKQGWMVEKLAERMAAHLEKENRLFWLPGVSDEMLLKLYTSCSALLSPSEGEGFGLPLIEAAQHGIPVIARDIAVFREVAGDHAHYFSGSTPADLAASLEHWLALKQQDKAPPSTGMPWLTWEASAQQVLNAVERQQWYKRAPTN